MRGSVSCYDVCMNIKLPATLTASYEVKTASYQCFDNGTGVVSIEFGGFTVIEIEIEKDGYRFESAYYSDGEDNSELSEFVAEWLKKIFTNALTMGG